MVGMQVLSGHSDKTGERRWHVIGCGVVAGLCFLLLPLAVGSVALTAGLLMVASVTIFAFLALFWTIPSAYLEGGSAAGGLAFISSIGATGGVFSPIYVGWMKDLTGSFYGSLGSLGLFLVLGMGLLYLTLRRPPATVPHIVGIAPKRA